MKWQELWEPLLSKQPAQEPDSPRCWTCVTCFTSAVPQQVTRGLCSRQALQRSTDSSQESSEGWAAPPRLLHASVLDTKVKSIGKCLTLLPELSNVRRQQASDKNPEHFCSSELAFHSYCLLAHIQD